MKAKLTWFKDTGKFYTDEEIDVDCEPLEPLVKPPGYEPFIPLYRIWDYIKFNCIEGSIPMKGKYLVIEVPDHPHNHPRLFIF